MTKVAKTRRDMWKELQNDDGLMLGYVSNVAMLLHDRHGITGVRERNVAAKEILELIFN